MPTRKTPIPNHARCLICGTDLSAPVFDCPECSTPHHAMCWQWSGGCAVYGCRRAARQVREPERDAEIQAIAAAQQRVRVYTPPRTASPSPTPPPDHGPAVEWVRLVVVCLFMAVTAAPPPKSPPARPAYTGRMPPPSWRVQTSRTPFMETLSAEERMADALLRDDREWEGTGSDPGPRLRRMMVARQGEALRSGVSKLATRDLPDWVKARVWSLQRVARGGLDLEQLALRRP